MLHFRYPKNPTNQSQPITLLNIFFVIVSVEMPVNVIVPLNIESNGGATTPFKNDHITPTGQWYAPSVVINDALIIH